MCTHTLQYIYCKCSVNSVNNLIRTFSANKIKINLVWQQLYKQESAYWGWNRKTIPTVYAHRTYCSSGCSEDCDDKSQADKKSSMELSLPDSCVKIIKVVPGKGPPPEPPVECCMSGCPNCVWIIYAEELKKYYDDGGESAQKAIEQIENPSLKAFLKLELALK